MIGLPAQARPLLVEAETGFTFSGGPKEKGDNANVRLNRNNLVFVCADALQVDDMLRKARTYLALQQMQQGDLFASLQSHQQDQVKERYGQAQQGFALAVQQCYRHVFYPERGQWPEVPLTHAAITVTSASSEPGFGQKQVERVLREARELVLAEDSPPAPNYMADKTPLKRIGVMSTRDLRNEYYRDPALPILLGDEVLKKCLRMGLDQACSFTRRGIASKAMACRPALSRSVRTPRSTRWRRRWS
jgi:hypothetical protein